MRERFAKWLHASPENIRAYLEVAAVWSELPTGDPARCIDVQALLAAASNSGNDNVIQLRTSQADTERVAPSRSTRSWALAASLALMITLIGTGFWLRMSGGRTYSTGIAEQRTLMLADGSTVILNALTTVRVHITKEARKITLIRGQAYFHDVDEPHRPFIVRSGNSTVRAIGTQFEVDKESDRTVVTVLDGQVVVGKSFAKIDSMGRRELLRVLAGSTDMLKAVLVPAGEQVTVLAQNIPMPKPVDLSMVSGWLHQQLIFDDTPLEEVAKQFNLYNRRRLVIADPSLRTVGIGGSYSASDPAALIGFLRSQPVLHVVETNDEILITRGQGRYAP